MCRVDGVGDAAAPDAAAGTTMARTLPLRYGGFAHIRNALREYRLAHLVSQTPEPLAIRPAKSARLRQAKPDAMSRLLSSRSAARR